MQLIQQMDPSKASCILINPVHVSTWFVRTFGPDEGVDRSGSVVTAVVPSHGRDSKYRLTPRMPLQEAADALHRLTLMMVVGAPGIVRWGAQGWEIVSPEEAAELLAAMERV